MPSVSNARHSEEWHDTKGIQLRKNGCQNVTLGWNKVAERIDTLIRNGRYTRLKEKNQRKEIRLVPDMEAYRNLKAERPQYMVGVRWTITCSLWRGCENGCAAAEHETA